MKRLRTSILAAAMFFAGGLAPSPCRAAIELSFYYALDLRSDRDVAALEPIWRRAAAAGYRKVFLSDPHFSRPDLFNAHFRANAAQVKGLATQLGIAIVPAVFEIGRSNEMLGLDPNLAEGVPVRDALFVVANGVAQLVPDPPVSLGTPEVVDAGVQVSGGVVSTSASMLSRAHRFRFTVPVSPFRRYHISVAIRSSGFSGDAYIRSAGDDQSLDYLRPLRIQPTQGWTTYDAVLNSLDHRRLVIWMGLWGSSKGSLDWTSWHIEEVGPLNVLRRPGTPVTVRSDQDGHAYVEGQDYGAVHDPAIDAVQGVGDYSEWHTPPSITTRLPAGTRLRVSWYHPTFFYNGNTSACPSDSGTMRLLANEAQAMKSLWGSSGYLLAHDEIRVMNWDASCAAVGGTAGNVLAAHVQKCVGLLRGTQVYAWGDMFDPNQNAVSSYYLVNGDLAGSWKGLDTSVVVLNWDSRHPAQALQFFAGLGHRQIIAGYYDGPVSAIDTWLAAARGVPGVCGVMYATWTDHYADLEAFAAAVRSATARDDRSVHR